MTEPPADLQRPGEVRGARPDARARRPVVIGALLAMLAAAGIVVVALGSGGGSKPVSDTPLLQAAYVATRGPGYRFAMTETVTHGEESTHLEADGAIDERTKQGTITERVAGQTVTEILSSPFVYVNVVGLPGARFAGRPWLEFNLDRYAEEFGGSQDEGISAGGPSPLIALMKAGGQVTVLGHESIAGETTTHYHALVDLDRYAATVAASQRAGAAKTATLLEKVTGSASLPIDVWIGSGDRLRRYQTDMQLCSPGGRMNVAVAFEILSYGPQSAVQVPPPGETRNLTSQLTAEAAKGLQQLACPG